MSVSRRLNVLCISSRIERWSEHHCSPSYMRELKFYSHGEHLQDRIMLLRRVDWTYKTSLITSLFIEVSGPSQEGERSCICV